MAYPAGVQTVTLRLGSSFDSAGTLASITGHVVPMMGAGADHLVWTATGQTYAKVRTALEWDDAEKVAYATVPLPTQAGWRDQTQASFSGWSYQISAVAVYASGERQSFERTVTPQPTDTVIDVDLLPNGAAATPTVVAEWEAARADALAALAATEVEQVALTEDLAYTLPAGVSPTRVHSVVFTQNATGGHTVTYGGQPITVDPTAGASTTVELHPVGAGYVVRYPATGPTSGSNTGDQDLSGLVAKAANLSDLTDKAAARANLWGSLPVPTRGAAPVAVLGSALTAARESVVAVVLGDSTGNDNNEWPYLTLGAIATKYPKYTAIYRAWSDPHQNYSGEILHAQIGTAGDAYATMTNTSGRSITTPHAPALNITGDLDIRLKVALNDWTPAATQYLITKFGDPPRPWAIYLGGTGRPALFWSADGTTMVETLASVAPTVADGDALWLRVTMDVDNGAGGYEVKWYTSTSVGYPTSWTQLGTTITGATTTTLATNTQPLEIGGRYGGIADRMQGKVYWAEVRAGIDGRVVASFDADLALPNKASVTSPEGNVWTIAGDITVSGAPCILMLNGSKSGAGVAYSADVTRLAAQTPIDPVLVCVNYGHNDAAAGYQAVYDGLLSQLAVRYPYAAVLALTQNPQVTPRTVAQIYTHWLTQKAVQQVAGSRGVAVADTYKAIMATADPSAAMLADGIHPNPATGSALQRDTVVAALGLA